MTATIHTAQGPVRIRVRTDDRDEAKRIAVRYAMWAFWGRGARPGRSVPEVTVAREGE